MAMTRPISEQVTFTQEGAGAVERLVSDKLRKFVTPEDFGAVGDGVTNDRLAMQAFFDYIKTKGRGIIPAKDYNLGALASDEKWAIYIDSPVDMVVDANHARFLCTTEKIKDSVIAIKNPVNITINNIRFTNPGFDIASTVGGGALRVGVYGIYLYATAPYSESNPCGNVHISGEAVDCIGFVAISTESIMGGIGAVAKAISNVYILGYCERVYYGLTAVLAGENINVKMDCVDVRRGALTYGQERASFDYSLRCSPNFIGSNAFIGLVCEGESIGNVNDIDIRVRVSGVEAHEAIVNFYHQQDEPNGQINNVRAYVTCDNLTTVGKSPSFDGYPFYVFAFMHTLVSGNNLNPTTRQINNMDIDCKIIGEISGGSYKVYSPPDQKKIAYVGAGVFEDAPSVATYALWQYFKVIKGRQYVKFNPIVIGATTAGTATYTKQEGEATVVDGICHFNINLTWSGHTGTGTMRVQSLPFIASPDVDCMVELIGHSSSNFSGNTLGLITTSGGVKTTITPYQIESGTSGLISLPASGTLYIRGSYPLY